MTNEQKGGIILRPPGVGGVTEYVKFLAKVFDIPVYLLYSDIDEAIWGDVDVVEFGQKRGLPVVGRRGIGDFIDRLEYAFWKPPKDWGYVISVGLPTKATVHYPDQRRIHLAIGFHQGSFGIPPRNEFSDFRIVEYLQKVNRIQLRTWEEAGLERADVIVAQSDLTKTAVEFYLGVSADEIIHPPVDVDSYFSDRPSDDNFYLYLGGLRDYKYLDQVVKAFNDLPHRLVIAGDGPERDKLERMAADNIDFVGYVSPEEKRRLFSRCKGLIQNHEFGTTAVEALAAGAPVIVVDHSNPVEKEVLRIGAYPTDLIETSVNGIVYEDSTGIKPLKEAVKTAENTTWDHDEIQESAERYGYDRIATKWRELIENLN